MANFTPIAGHDGVLTIDGTTIAGLRNFSVEVTTDTIEFTAMGDQYRKYTNGLSSWTGSADIYFQAAEGTKFNLTTATIGTYVPIAKFYVAEDTTDTAYTGTCVITGFTVNSTNDGLVEASISLQGAGALNYTTGSNVA